MCQYLVIFLLLYEKVFTSPTWSAALHCVVRVVREAQEGREDGMKWAEGSPYGGVPLSFLAKTADAKGKGLVDRLTTPIFESKGMGAIAIGVWLFG